MRKVYDLIKKLKRIPVNFYLFKVNHKNTRKRYKICSNLKKKTPERRHWRRSGVYIFNLENISHFISSVSIVDFK